MMLSRATAGSVDVDEADVEIERRPSSAASSRQHDRPDVVVASEAWSSHRCAMGLPRSSLSRATPSADVRATRHARSSRTAGRRLSGRRLAVRVRHHLRSCVSRRDEP